MEIQRSSFAMFVVAVAIVLEVHRATPSEIGRGSRLTVDFPDEAREVWNDHRKDHFRSRRALSTWTSTARRKQGLPVAVSSGTDTYYCDGTCWFFKQEGVFQTERKGEKSEDSEARVIAANSQYAFHLESKSNFGYRLINTEISPEPVPPWTLEDLEIRFNPRELPAKALR